METRDPKDEEICLSKKFSEKCTTSDEEQKKEAPVSSGNINAFYTQALKTYPVTLCSTETKGRHAVASADIDQGTTVCLEKATAFVVRSEYINQQCHVCLDSLPPTRTLMCSDCKKTFYCSEKCLDQDQLHLLTCSALSQVDAIGRSTDVDPDLLRLIILLLARRQHEKEGDTPSNKETPFWCVSDLISHQEHASPEFIQVITQAAHRLLPEMPTSMQVPAEEIVTLACRINANAHGLGDNQSRNTDVALGLFPLGALFFNHGCNPNAAFVGREHGQLEFRTIRPVKSGEELTVSYIDIYAPRDERHRELYFSKHFWCQCERCTEPIATSVDRFLEGIVCTQCSQDVYAVPESSLKDISQFKRQMENDDETSWPCAGCGHKADAKEIREKLRQAETSYEAGITAMQQRKTRAARDILDSLAKTSPTLVAGELHSLHAVRLNASIPLMNCQRRDRDLKGAIATNRSIIELLSSYAKHGLPKYTGEASDFWQNLGELCNALASEYRACGRTLLEKKWRKEANSVYKSTVEYRAIVYGRDHPKTKQVTK